MENAPAAAKAPRKAWRLPASATVVATIVALLLLLPTPAAALAITAPVADDSVDPSSLTFTITMEDGDNLPFTWIIIDFDCSISGAGFDAFTMTGDPFTQDHTIGSLLTSQDPEGFHVFGPLQGEQTGYGWTLSPEYHAGVQEGTANETFQFDSGGYGYGYGYGGYGYGYGYNPFLASNDLAVLVSLSPPTFAPGETCTAAVSLGTIESPLPGDFTSERSDPFSFSVAP